MPEYKIKTYNKIARVGLNRFSKNYSISENEKQPDAIILRSYNLHGETISGSVLAVGRAGAGVNNVPVEELTQRGVVVFNTPGGNANSVKELVIAALFIAARNIPEALDYTKKLSGENLAELVEKGKKQFAGSELYGKTLGVIGLGAIGHRVANSAVDLGMSVYGYDPAMTVENAWQLSAAVHQVEELGDIFNNCDYVTIHVPLIEPTKGMISEEIIARMKPGAVLINFSRDKIVDEKSLLQALDAGKLARYVTDFPNEIVKGHPKVTALPHLGASTEEAEDNCAIMVADQLKHYLEDGNIKHSVNFPKAKLARRSPTRITIAHKNEPGMVAKFSSALAEDKINISELLNVHRNDLAYTIIDIESKNISPVTKKRLGGIEQVMRLRII